MLIGIDLLWVRPKICGGTESVIRNLINGFGMYDEKNEYILFVGRDTAYTFAEYGRYGNIQGRICETDSLKRIKRIAWENMKLDKLARSLKVDVMFVPVYSKPNSRKVEKGGIPYVTVIYDLQAIHYPEYFSGMKLIFAKRSWKKACKESVRVLTTSEYGKKDIVSNYPAAKDKTEIIYAPVVVNDKTDKEAGDRLFAELSDKYGIEENRFFYTVSSMMPHKNLDTVLKVMKECRENGNLSDFKLVVSGVGGNKKEFDEKVREYGIEDRVTDTGFVSDEERDILYEKCGLFLFPSEFEGFGMPPVEAMMKGARVVTTKCSCIEEVTDGRAAYVDNPRDVKEWTDTIVRELAKKKEIAEFPQYDLKTITEKYLDLFERIS